MSGSFYLYYCKLMNGNGKKKEAIKKKEIYDTKKNNYVVNAFLNCLHYFK